MERKIIEFSKGIHRAPTTGAQGELSECVDLVVKDGEIMNAPVAKEVGVTIPSGYTLAYIHETTQGKNYILKCTDGSLAYMREGETEVAHGEMDEYTKQQKYQELVTGKEDNVKATREQIYAVKQKLNTTGNVTEANTKMSEYASLLGDKLESYIEAYDTKHSTSKLDEWDALTPLQKYEKINNEDYERTMIYDSIEDKSINLYSPYHTYWFAFKTNKSTTNAEYWIVGEAKTASDGSIAPKEDGKAQMKIKKVPTTYTDDDGNVHNGYNYYLVGGEYLVDVDMSALLGSGESKDGDYCNALSVIGTIKTEALEKANEDEQYIIMLTDNYYQYYIVASADSEKDTLTARLAELEALLATYTTQYNEALVAYNTYLANNTPIFKICTSPYKDITNVGNVLSVATNGTIVTSIYQDDKYINNNIPNIDLQFRLNSKFVYDSSARNVEVSKTNGKEEYSIDYCETNLLVARIWGTMAYFTRTFELSEKLSANKWAKIVFTAVGGSTFGGAKKHITLLGDNDAYEDQKFSSKDNKYEAEFRPSFDVKKIEIWTEPRGNIPAELIDNESRGILIRLDVYSSKAEEGYNINNTSDTHIAIQGDVNKFIKTQSVYKNRFMFPFFVRYAFKMFDGTFIYPSAPVLMIPNVGRVPFTIMGGLNDKASGIPSSLDLMFFAYTSNLQYRVMNSESDLKALLQYKKLIKEICIAVTSPIYTFDTICEYKEGENTWGISHVNALKSFDEDYGIGASIDASSQYSRRMPICSDILTRFATNGNNDSYIVLDYPPIKDKDVNDSVVSHSNFYIVKSYTVEELYNNYENLVFKDVVLEDNTLEGLVGREKIKDNTTSLNSYYADFLFSYNKRLVAGNIAETKYKGYNPGVINGNCYADFVRHGKADGDTIATSKYQDENVNFNMDTRYGAVVEINIDGTTYKVYKPISTEPSAGVGELLWFYYPSSNAKRVTIYRRRKGTSCNLHSIGYGVNDFMRVSVELRENPYLDGAYWFKNYNNLVFDENLDVFDENGNADVNMCDEDTKIILGLKSAPSTPVVHKNKVIQTFVNNPFAFDMESAEYVGNGELRAISTNAKALSQGQFGQFPLICFASDGIWSVEIGSDGKWQSKQPISRDVILNGSKPCQTDTSVVFPCNDGIKVIYGSEVKNISTAMQGMYENHSVFTNLLTDFSDLVMADGMLFNEIINGAKFVYDSANNLIHLFSTPSTNNDLHYIYSLETDEWSKSSEDIAKSIVPGYPYTTMQRDNKLYQYHKSNDDSTVRKGLLLTREFCYDNPLAPKMLYDIRVLSKKNANSKIQIALFVSDDRKNWKRLTSLKHSSWKWYRLVVFTEMTDQEGIECFVSDVDEKFTNKIR